MQCQREALGALATSLSAGPQPARKAIAVVDRLGLPAKPEIEINILGGIFNSTNPNETFGHVSQLLEVSAFSLEKTRLVFEAMKILYEAGEAINWVTVGNELGRKQPLDFIGSITEFSKGMPEIHNILSMCRIVAECAIRRRLSVAVDDIQVRLLSECESLHQIELDTVRILTPIFSRHQKIDIDQIPNFFRSIVRVLNSSSTD